MPIFQDNALSIFLAIAALTLLLIWRTLRSFAQAEDTAETTAIHLLRTATKFLIATIIAAAASVAAAAQSIFKGV